MSQITAILPQVKDKTRFNISVDGKFAFAADAETILKEGLRVGKTLTPEDIERLKNQNETGLLINKVLGILSRRPRSKREIEQYLQKKHAAEKEKELILQRLEHLGYINDEEFIKWWREQRQTFRPRGKRALYQELRQKGIAEELIKKMLEDTDEKSEFNLAQRLAQKRLSHYGNLSGFAFKQKMGRYLSSHGFSWDTIKDVIDSLVKKD